MAAEYNCEDCGMHVILCSTNEQPKVKLCMGCSFLRGIEDPEIRKEAREFLERTGEPCKG